MKNQFIQYKKADLLNALEDAKKLGCSSLITMCNNRLKIYEFKKTCEDVFIVNKDEENECIFANEEFDGEFTSIKITTEDIHNICPDACIGDEEISEIASLLRAAVCENGTFNDVIETYVQKLK